MEYIRSLFMGLMDLLIYIVAVGCVGGAVGSLAGCVLGVPAGAITGALVAPAVLYLIGGLVPRDSFAYVFGGSAAGAGMIGGGTGTMFAHDIYAAFGGLKGAVVAILVSAPTGAVVSTISLALFLVFTAMIRSLFVRNSRSTNGSALERRSNER